MKRKFTELCKIVLTNVPACAVYEEQRTTLFSVGSRYYGLSHDEICEVYKKVFGFVWFEK